MKFYESIQSNSGQLIAGVGIPGTDIEISRPLIPVAELHFDNNYLAAIGTFALVGGAVAAIRHKRNTTELIDTVQFPAGSDMNERVQNNIVRGRRIGLARGLLATGIISAGVIDASHPHTDKTTNEIESIAVIVDAGYEGFARDVNTTNGETTSRIEATVNTINQLGLDGIDVTFIAAGANPRQMGVVRDGEGVGEVVDKFTKYTADLSNQSTPKGGGGDLTTALSIADAINPDKILIFTGSMEDHDQSPILVGQELPENNQISIIAVGKSGSVFNSLTATYEAPIDTILSESIVGPDDSYSAESTDELRGVVKSIIDSQIQSTERNDVKFFKQVRNTSAIALGALSFAIFGLESRQRGTSVIKKRK